MEKVGAKGGYVITTSSFTTAARQYADGLEIELIDGVKLVELWLSGMVNGTRRKMTATAIINLN